MVCKLCEKRQNIDPICAFDNFYKVFASNNSNCITMNILRNIAEELGLYYRDDNSAGSIGIVPLTDLVEDAQGYIVITWYKNRAETGNALVVWDDETPKQLTEKIATDAIKSWANKRIQKYNFKGVRFSNGLLEELKWAAKVYNMG